MKKISGFIMLVVLSLAARGFSGCGLGYCPLNQTREGGEKYLIQLNTDLTSFHIESQKGVYIRLIPKLEAVINRFFMTGIVGSAVALYKEPETIYGPGNLMLYMENRLLNQGGLGGAWGVQLEAPVGDGENGLASEHWELLPYIQLTFQENRHLFNFAGGFRLSLEDSDGHHHGSPSAQLVEPHGDNEWVTLLKYQRSWDSWSVSFSSENQLETGHFEWNDLWGARVSYKAKGNWELPVYLSVPLFSRDRLNWRLGTGIKLSL